MVVYLINQLFTLPFDLAKFLELPCLDDDTFVTQLFTN
jgi:hypothetical protein